MDEDHAFLNLIAAEPDDLTLRLVYCDWLEERGDPRCPYLRLWCHLATFPAEEWIGFPHQRIELARLASDLPGDWLESIGCRRFYLDHDAAVKVARQFLQNHFPRSFRFWIDPADSVEHAVGWYFAYRSPDTQSPPVPYMMIFVDRARARAEDVKRSRPAHSRELLRIQRDTGHPI